MSLIPTTRSGKATLPHTRKGTGSIWHTHHSLVLNHGSNCYTTDDETFPPYPYFQLLTGTPQLNCARHFKCHYQDFIISNYFIFSNRSVFSFGQWPPYLLTTQSKNPGGPASPPFLPTRSAAKPADAAHWFREIAPSALAGSCPDKALSVLSGFPAL